MKLRHPALPFIFNETAYSIRRRLTLVLPEPWHYLHPEAQQTLHRLIRAVGLDPMQVPILLRMYLSEQDIPMLNTDIILAFGIPFASVKENYTVLQKGSTSVLLAEEITAFTSDKEAKQKLWRALKPLFGVK